MANEGFKRKPASNPLAYLKGDSHVRIIFQQHGNGKFQESYSRMP